MTIYIGCDAHMPLGSPHMQRLSFYGYKYKKELNNQVGSNIYSTVIPKAWKELIISLTVHNTELSDVIILTWGGPEEKIIKHSLDTSPYGTIFNLSVIDLQKECIKSTNLPPGLRNAFNKCSNYQEVPNFECPAMKDAYRIFIVREVVANNKDILIIR